MLPERAIWLHELPREVIVKALNGTAIYDGVIAAVDKDKSHSHRPHNNHSALMCPTFLS